MKTSTTTIHRNRIPLCSAYSNSSWRVCRAAIRHRACRKKGPAASLLYNGAAQAMGLTFLQKLAGPPKNSAEMLMTPKDAASKLGISLKTLMAHVSTGNIRYVNIGTKKRRICRFTQNILDRFIEKRKTKEYQKCLSINYPAHHITTTTSNGAATSFENLLDEKTKKKPKKLSVKS